MGKMCRWMTSSRATASGRSFFLVAAESSGIPVPGETALVAAAVLASQGVMVLWEVLVVAAARRDHRRQRRLLDRSQGRPGAAPPLAGHAITAQRLLPPGERFFRRHGPKTVFFARFIAGLRVTAAWIAGITHMHWGTFLTWNALGGIVWAFGYGLLAYFFGKALVDAVTTLRPVRGRGARRRRRRRDRRLPVLETPPPAHRGRRPPG